ncbi:dual specificity protein kinase YAK1 homolog isoform X2 [Cryptomeria japonica]|uniref:dual specificity protein kinase YAK1 homolog isoform X2 n=1 Tax=Cryptomeria japonica TaxID=3369 RepID=UPI0027DA67CD|nr:dual specificity protein kinase YAK1 homolog isoform X2 [Cryptomeria japonica]
MERGSSSGTSPSSEDETDLPQSGNRNANSSWRPSAMLFRPYIAARGRGASHSPGSLRVIVGKPLVVKLTKDIIETYQICNPTFTYSDSFNPKRYLTNPSTGVLNDAADNANSDLILTVNAILVNSDANRRYIVKDILGQGTFGQVAKCWAPETNSFVAVKIIKNQPAYYHQALVEISILNMLNKKFDPEDKHHIVRILDHFVCQRHLCIAFEILGVNLFELLKLNQYRGISLNLLRLFAKQILDALLVLREASVIHCDLKPENILLSTSLQLAEIKLIDFGSACMENRTVYSYIQSRFYRSPEVLLGHPYTTAIDMWSFGCIVAELFLGLPLFPGASEYDLIKRMIEILGGQPPDHILRSAKNTNKYFKHVGGSSRLDENRATEGQKSVYRFLNETEYETREMKKPAIAKRYFNYETLEDIIFNYPHRKKITEEEISKENQTRLAFVDFLRGLFQFDPVKRWTPRQAAQHPFVTEEAFTGPYKPTPETPRTPVCQIVMVDHNPGSGHWFGAGLSPQVTNMNKGIRYNSPQYQMAPFSYASSYGSLGSHGSYGDGVGFGSSFGSYGDSNNIYTGHRPTAAAGINSQTQTTHGSTGLGTSPDTRWRLPQVPPGHGLGVSPSSVMFRPMSLGASPSQFTPPNSQIQGSSGSPIGSPGRYGPTSPARSGIHVTGLGKAAAVGQYHKRRGLGIPGSLHLPPQENVAQHWQGHQANFGGNVDAGATSSADGTARGSYMGSPRGGQGNAHLQHWRQKGGNGTNTASAVSNNEKTAGLRASGSLGILLTSTELASEGLESNSPPPDPGDWDPNYSDELLLQEDGSEVISPKSGVSGGIRSGQVSGTASTSGTGVGRYGRGHTQSPSSNNNSNAYRLKVLKNLKYPHHTREGPLKRRGRLQFDCNLSNCYRGCHCSSFKETIAVTNLFTNTTTLKIVEKLSCCSQKGSLFYAIWYMFDSLFVV